MRAHLLFLLPLVVLLWLWLSLRFLLAGPFLLVCLFARYLFLSLGNFIVGDLVVRIGNIVLLAGASSFRLPLFHVVHANLRNWILPRPLLCLHPWRWDPFMLLSSWSFPAVSFVGCSGNHLHGVRGW